MAPVVKSESVYVRKCLTWDTVVFAEDLCAKAKAAMKRRDMRKFFALKDSV